MSECKFYFERPDRDKVMESVESLVAEKKRLERELNLAKTQLRECLSATVEFEETRRILLAVYDALSAFRPVSKLSELPEVVEEVLNDARTFAKELNKSSAKERGGE